ncbi:MAG TPA: LysM peptidoglycan-binding domain-containing protein, partial [Candidatus Dormibacteraeota bacterium]|nr:LysM peptidoglycan-binding domain-containing protein [Candidatus Dormibacteraeota bacterium]
MRSYRYVSHAAVLLIAILTASYTASDLALPLASRQAALDAQAAVTGGSYGGFALGPDGTIIKPISIPTSVLPNRRAIRYVVKEGDTLDSIGQASGVTLREITWSNPGLKLPLKIGQALELPPLPGVVVVVKPGDSPASIATRYGVDVTTLLGFNDLRPE